MCDIVKKKKKTGKDSIILIFYDPDEYVRTRLREDFNSIQLIACSRLCPIIRIDPQFRGPDYLGAGNWLYR